MRYDSAKDMFLDNRRGLEDDIKHLSDEDKERVLSAFDWAVHKALEIQKSSEILKEELIARYSEEEVKKLATASAKRFKELGQAVSEYDNDVESGKRVGYSAEREQVEQEEEIEEE